MKIHSITYLLNTFNPSLALFVIENVNWTVIISIVTICLAAMGTLTKIYGSDKKISDEKLRNSPYLQKVEKDLLDKEIKLSNLKDIVNTQNVEVEKLKIESKNSNKSLSEIKQDNRDLVQRLDDLLKQFMEYMDV